MKPLVVVVACLAALLLGVLAGPWLTTVTPPPSPHGGGAAVELDELRAAIAALTQRLDALEHARPATVTVQRSDAMAPDAASPPPAGAHDAQWYLEQYVLSFDDDVQGVEYYRLAVEAHAAELTSPIAALVRDGARPVALRIALVNMLGRQRFAELPDVLEALLAAVPPPAPDALALRALEALARIGTPAALPGLEGAIALLREAAVRERAIALLVDLADGGANAALFRLFAHAGDDALRRLLIRYLDGADLQAALDVLRAASACEQPVRLDAAQKVHEFDEPEFDAFAAQWRQVEGDPEVRAALGPAGQASPAAGWTARKACGPPDADRTRDDPNAWASKSPEMGLQWLQLTYANPMRADGVRVFEVNSTGAVAEVLARGTDGAWSSLWRGTADGGQGPLLIRFPLTAFAVRQIRLVLDTNRKPGWNEIDAVELLGPGGNQWAERAVASSSYGANRKAAGGASDLDLLRYEQIQSRRR
ncbi:MAG: hypothetical protein U1E73_00220 [Planctomycetota bacterium]